MQALSDLLQRVVDYITPLAESLGAPGLALVALLDSSFLSLPQVTDALIIGFTLKHPSQWLVHAISATIGSVAGCAALYFTARKGGEAFLRSRFKAHHIERGLAIVRKHGWLAVTVPSLLPPPTPFKLFVLLAGVANLRPLTFVLAAGLGRSLRYGGEAWLTYAYGERASIFIRDNLPTVLMAAAALLVVGAVALVLWRRRSGGTTPQDTPGTTP